jgi:hypothetical protein
LLLLLKSTPENIISLQEDLDMPITDRRTLLQAAAALPLVAATGNAALAQAPQTAAGAAAKPAPAKDVTRILAHYLVTATYDDLPANVRKEGCGRC